MTHQILVEAQEAANETNKRTAVHYWDIITQVIQKLVGKTFQT